MSITRMIKFDFCQVYKKTKRKHELYQLYDIENLINAISTRDLERKEIDIYDGCKIRVEKFDFDKDYGVWSLRIMRMRDTNYPYVLKPDEEAKPLEIGDDEYLGEDMTMLFDIENNVAMIQRNRYALGFKNLQKAFAKIINDESALFEIRPISREVDINKIKKDYFKSVEIKFANVKFGSADAVGGALGSIIKAYIQLGGHGGGFMVNLGRSGKKSLAKEPTQKFLKQVVDNQDLLSSAILRAKNAEDEDIDIYNLFANVYSVFIPFQLAEKMPLDYSYCVRKMLNKYLEEKDTIQNII